MDRREFLKYTIATVISLPVIGAITQQPKDDYWARVHKEALLASCESEAMCEALDAVRAMLYLNNAWVRDVWISRLTERHYIPAEVALEWDKQYPAVDRVVFPFSETCACFELVETEYFDKHSDGRVLYAVYECNDPRFVGGSDNQIHFTESEIVT